MKKILLLLAMTAGALAAQAADYAYLVFLNTDGTTTALSVTDLTVTVTETQLQVTNADGTVSFLLTDLEAMQFSTDGELTALPDVLNADAAVEVYTLTGLAVGTYDNLLQAVNALDKGVYVITDGKNAQKIVVQ